jgi:hypothetical protein
MARPVANPFLSTPLSKPMAAESGFSFGLRIVYVAINPAHSPGGSLCCASQRARTFPVCFFPQRPCRWSIGANAVLYSLGK